MSILLCFVFDMTILVGQFYFIFKTVFISVEQKEYLGAWVAQAVGASDSWLWLRW